MINLSPLAQTIVFAVLIVGYIITFFFQKSKIDILKGTVTALKELTDGQKNHIETYKGMVDINAIKGSFEYQRELLFKKTWDVLGDFFYEANTQPIIDKWSECCIFLGRLFFDKDLKLTDRFSEQEREDIINTHFKKNDYVLRKWFEECQQLIATQTPPTQ
jgi:hypothetical protein